MKYLSVSTLDCCGSLAKGMIEELGNVFSSKDTIFMHQLFKLKLGSQWHHQLELGLEPLWFLQCKDLVRLSLHWEL